MKLFIDSWGWVNLFNRQEDHHLKVTQYYREARRKQGEIYTSDYVLDETITLLFRRLPVALAIEAMDSLQQSILQRYLQLEWITLDRFDQIRTLRLKFQDKPLISFTDLSSMVIMQELNITAILTADAHFSHVGLGFQRVP